ncbi:Cytochrome c [Hibiscus syriacus]|uniref:Cytochrome c n=1 Tax=Hibiscus syriacus TaxID=106335 RepID=A0A6A3ASP6_HIBSY|nr:Cytochrome c [Hibiscus syriacus]
MFKQNQSRNRVASANSERSSEASPCLNRTNQEIESPVQIPSAQVTKPVNRFANFLFFSFILSGEGLLTGPNLNGLFGRQSGTTPGYSYSAANKNMAVIGRRNSV